MSDLFIVVALKSKAGKEMQLQKDLLDLVGPSRQEDGNLRYELFADIDEPGRFVFVEHWASAEARERHHTQSAHIQHFHANGVANVETTEFSCRLTSIG